MKFIRLSGSELTERIHARDEHDVFQRLKYLCPNEIFRETHYFAEERGTLAGVLSVEINPYDPSVLWVKHVVVDPAFRRQGIATRLVQETFPQLEKDFPDITTVELSTFTEEGRLHLRSMIAENAHLLGTLRMDYSQMDRDDDTYRP